MPSDTSTQKHHPILQGFQKPNGIITPNQFFDVCLPHHSTPVIRVVGFILQQTLGYTNDDGDPFQERFQFSHKQIAAGAGVAPSAVKKALDQAVEARFLKRLHKAMVSRKGQAAQSAAYELRWHDYPDGRYETNPHRFMGFFAAEGNRTSIPTEFFTHVLRHNTKAAIRFVGAVIRNTLGIKASHGKGRVKRAKLSYRYLQRYLKLSSRSLASAIKKAMAMNYVVRLEEGVFDAKHPENNREAIYTVKWCQSPQETNTLSTPKSNATNHTKNESETTPKSTAAIHTKKYGLYKRFPKGNRNKQQEPVVANASFHKNPQAIERLINEGFNQSDAITLSNAQSPEVIQQQIAWLPQRHPKQPLAMLRRAIEHNWSAPSDPHKPTTPEAKAFAKGFYAGRWDSESSVSEPGARDLNTAQRIVDQLTAIHGGSNPDLTHRWGTGFGRQYGRDFPTAIPSLAFAGRILADDLIRSHRRRAESNQVRQQLKRSPKNEPMTSSPDRGAWLDYLAAEEPQLRQRDPDAFTTFEERRAVQRRNLQRSGMPRFACRMIEMMDERATYLADLQQAFPNQLHDFERWRDQQSPNPLQANLS